MSQTKYARGEKRTTSERRVDSDKGGADKSKGERRRGRDVKKELKAVRTQQVNTSQGKRQRRSQEGGEKLG